MKTRSILAAAGLLAFTCAVLPVRADDAAVRKQLDAQYAKLITAFKNKNVKGITALSTPDFTMKEKSGQVSNAEQSVQGLKQMFGMAKSMNKVDMKVQKLTVKGNQAVATASYLFDMTIPGDKGKTAHMVSKGVDKDVWVKSGSTWKIKSVETIKDETTLDGKPFDPTNMAPPSAAPAPKKKK